MWVGRSIGLKSTQDEPVGSQRIMMLQLNISCVSTTNNKNIRMNRAYVAYQDEKISRVKIKTEALFRRYSEKVKG